MKYETLAKRYTDNTARHYDRDRTDDRKWHNEQAAMNALLSLIPEGASLIDIPVGTGRFFDLYKKYSLRVTGMDISADMREQARQKALTHDFSVTLKHGDIRNIDAENHSVDVALCIRFLNWVKSEDLVPILGELKRISKKYVLVGLRHDAPASELSLSRRVMQILARLRRRSGLHKITVHKKDAIEDAFKTCGLHEISRICVENKYDGSDYYFYLMEKK